MWKQRKLRVLQSRAETEELDAAEERVAPSRYTAEVEVQTAEREANFVHCNASDFEILRDYEAVPQPCMVFG